MIYIISSITNGPVSISTSIASRELMAASSCSLHAAGVANLNKYSHLLGSVTLKISSDSPHCSSTYSESVGSKKKKTTRAKQEKDNGVQ
jgi:hypothetical protein